MIKLARKQIKPKVYAFLYERKRGTWTIGIGAGYNLKEATKTLSDFGQLVENEYDIVELDLEEIANEFTEEVRALKKLKS